MAVTRSDLLVAGASFVVVVALGVVAQLLIPAAVVPITVAGGVAVLGVLIARARRAVVVGIDDPSSGMRQTLRGIRTEIEETRALVALQDPAFTLPLPWSNWALPPRAVLEVLKTVQEFDAPTIVDCGTGVTTLHLARAVRALGAGRVVALEQDQRWADYLRRILERNDLQQWVTIVVAPLRDVNVLGRTIRWYDLPGDVLGGGEVDVLVVDGPTGVANELARAGALPHFWPRLSRRGAVFLDDTLRAEEQEICRLWREAFPIAEASVGAEHGMSKFTRQPA